MLRVKVLYTAGNVLDSFVILLFVFLYQRVSLITNGWSVPFRPWMVSLALEVRK